MSALFLAVNGVDISGVTREPRGVTGTPITADGHGRNATIVVPDANALLRPADAAACTPQGGGVLLVQLETLLDTTLAFFEAG
jgi:hypothetical protein